MKTLVVYYSRTGCTRKVAEHIAQSLQADLLELKEQANRRGMRGFITGGYDAIRHKRTELMPFDIDLQVYDLIITGSPVWAGTLCPAVRTFLQKAAPSIQRIAFFCTHGGGGPAKSYVDATSVVGKPLIANTSFRDRAIKGGTAIADIDTFIEQLASEPI